MKPFIHISIVLGIVFGSTVPVAESLPIPSVYAPSIRQIIVKSAVTFNTNPEILLKVAMCESSLNPQSIGDHGHAIGIFQYHKNTFERFVKLYGEPLDYHSSFDQAKLTAFIFKTYPQYRNNWSCWRKINRLYLLNAEIL